MRKNKGKQNNMTRFDKASRRSRLVVASLTALLLVAVLLLQIIENETSFISMSTSATFTNATIASPLVKEVKNADHDTFDVPALNLLSLAHQDLPRRNISRNLCGVIPDSSPKAVHFPSILMTQNTQQQQQQPCRPNAILYMVQKGSHSSYGRNSSALFFKSLDLLYQNYLSVDHHSTTVDVIIVHTGDYNEDDLDMFDRRYNHTVHFKLVDLNNTDYWTLPEVVRHDNISEWGAYPEFSIGYRHMIRWYALKLYDFIRDYATMKGGCSYQYLMRMDEDSFIHSPIQYDLFEFMQSHSYSYAFRMCAYEMKTDVWDDYLDHVEHCGKRLPHGTPYRKVQPELCGFYNNFFILQVTFILQPQVQDFLQWTDAVGIMYRERYNDLQIQAMAVYAFLPPERIHRFLDWTYEHMSYMRVKKLDCPFWGSIQAGYLDSHHHVNATFRKFKQESNMNRPRCTGKCVKQYFNAKDLSPTYSHLPPSQWWNETFGVEPHEFQWRTVAAGAVEVAYSGVMSG